MENQSLPPNTFDNNFGTNQIQKPISTKIPDGLKVFCILSIVWCSLAMLSSLYGMKYLFQSDDSIYKEVDKMAQLYEKMGQSFDQDATFNQLKDSGLQNLIALVLNIFSLIGVIWMLKGLKKGLIVYAVAELLPWLSIFLLGGTEALKNNPGIKMMGNGGLAIAIIMFVFMIVIDLAFIFLYRHFLNKHHANLAAAAAQTA